LNTGKAWHLGGKNMAVCLQVADEAVLQPASTKLFDRMERLPMSRWHFKARAIIGTATFFDGFDSLAIGMVLPVIAAAWKMTPGEVGWLISGGFLGQMIGAIGFGQLAERLGRIPAIMITTAVFALGGIASAFAWGFVSMQVIRVVQGLGLGAEVPIAATYINEIAPAERRGRFVLLYEVLFAIGLLLAGVIGRWIIPTWGWQSLFLVGSVPPLIAALLIPTLPESPRWLIGKGRLDAASKAVDQIEAAITAEGRKLPPPVQTARPAIFRAGHWSELFSPQYRTRTLVMWAIWLTIGCISWPLTIWMPTIYARVFQVPLETALNFGMYNNFIIISGAIACALLIDYTGRRAWFCGALFIASLALIILGIMGANTVTSVFLMTSITLFCITSLNLAIYLYTPEVFPTRLRAVACGISLAWARVGAMTAPPVIGWAMAGNQLSRVFLGLGVIAFCTGLITAVFAVETRRRVLEEVSP
jgi:MFS transporter, putative metabolite:H+ symporter